MDLVVSFQFLTALCSHPATRQSRWPPPASCREGPAFGWQRWCGSAGTCVSKNQQAPLVPGSQMPKQQGQGREGLQGPTALPHHLLGAGHSLLSNTSMAKNPHF